MLESSSVRVRQLGAKCFTNTSSSFLLTPLVEDLGLGNIPLFVKGLGLSGDAFSVVLFCFFGHLIDFFASFLSSYLHFFQLWQIPQVFVLNCCLQIF